MLLREILDVPRIDLSLDASDKRAALEAMARLLCAGPAGAHEPTELSRILAERERLGSTGVGDGVAIPHGRVPGLDHFVAALGVSRGGIPFESVDGAPVDVFFALVGPERAAGEHLKCLARIGRLLRDPGVRRCLRESDDPRAAMAVVLAADTA
jgi:PTS system nitrogen regulatory IIA component